MSLTNDNCSLNAGFAFQSFVIHSITCRVILSDWIGLRMKEKPTAFFSTSVYLSVFRQVTAFQSQFGNRIVMLNTNRIRHDIDHDTLKDDVLTSLRDTDVSLSESSFHLVRYC